MMNYNFDDRAHGGGPPEDFMELGAVMQDFVPNLSHRHLAQSDKFTIPTGSKRTASNAGMQNFLQGNMTPNGCDDFLKSEGMSSDDECLDGKGHKTSEMSNGKKTKGRVKIKMEFIDNKLRRYTTFSKRKTGIMKKAYELSTLTGTQVMLLVASETGHVYTFATRKLQPMITSEAGKALIQTCLNSPDIPASPQNNDQRMCATGFEETDLSYNIADDENSKEQGLSCSSPEPSSPFSDVESPSMEDLVSASSPSFSRDNKNLSFINQRFLQPSVMQELSRSNAVHDSSGNNSDDPQLMHTFASLRNFENHDNTEGGASSKSKVPSSTHPTLSYRLSTPPILSAHGSIENLSTSSPPDECRSSSPPPAMLNPHQSVRKSSQSPSGLAKSVAATLPNTVMYHTGQGLVYATPTSAVLPDGSNVILNFTTAPQTATRGVGLSSDQLQSQPTQQYITIPVPMSLTSPQLVPSLSPAILQQQGASSSKSESSRKKKK